MPQNPEKGSLATSNFVISSGVYYQRYHRSDRPYVNSRFWIFDFRFIGIDAESILAYESVAFI
jgi:hypothetical protein